VDILEKENSFFSEDPNNNRSMELRNTEFLPFMQLILNFNVLTGMVEET